MFSMGRSLIECSTDLYQSTNQPLYLVRGIVKTIFYIRKIIWNNRSLCSARIDYTLSRCRIPKGHNGGKSSVTFELDRLDATP